MTALLALWVAFGAADDLRAAPAELTLPRSYEVVALMPLSSLGSTGEVVEAIERVLTGEMRKVLGKRLVAPEELRKKGAAAGEAFMQCEGMVVCLVEVMGGLGWDGFVVGNIAGLGDDTVIHLKLIDVRTGQEARRATANISADEQSLIAEMRRAAVTLVAPELLVGTVVLDCKQSDVEILIDGQLLGRTPLVSPRVKVPVGRHAIEASGEGLVPFSTFIEVAYGEIIPVEIVLPTNTIFVGGNTPFRSRWWTWTLFGVGVVAGGVGGLFNYLHVDAVNQINALAQANQLTIDRMQLYRDADQHFMMAMGFYIGGAVIVATVATLLGIDLALY